MFHSTRPHGERHLFSCSSSRSLDSFNPRAREGRDSMYICSIDILAKFQSTRLRGARLNYNVLDKL